MAMTSKSVKSPRVVNIEDLRVLARRRQPKMVFDYLDGGAEAEGTLRENCRAFESVTFRPRQAVAAPSCELRATRVSIASSFPGTLAPGGYRRPMDRARAVGSTAAG